MFFPFVLSTYICDKRLSTNCSKPTEYHEFEAIMTHQHRQLGLCTKKLKHKKKKKLDLLVH